MLNMLYSCLYCVYELSITYDDTVLELTGRQSLSQTGWQPGRQTGIQANSFTDKQVQKPRQPPKPILQP